MNIETILILLCISALIVYWAHHNRIGEKAVKAAKNHTDSQGLQFLDQGVVLVKIGINSSPFKLRLVRTFRFEFASKGDRRYWGWIIMDGMAVKSITLQPFSEGSLH